MNVDNDVLKYFDLDRIDNTNKDELVNIENAIKRAKLSSIEQLNSELEQLAQVPVTNRWSDLMSLARGRAGSKNSVSGNFSAIYGITYIDDDGRIWYIGQSSAEVTSRLTRVRGVFKNEGVSSVSANGRSSDHPGASKMYNKDPDLDNWNVKVIKCVGLPKTFIENLEKELISIYNPPFNTECMAGV